MSTTYQDIGSKTGPLRHIWIGADGSFQVEHVADANFEFYPPTSHLADAGVFLATDGRLYTPDLAGHDATGLSIGSNLFDQHSQSVVATANGVSRVITQLQTLGDDLTLTLVDTYVHGQACWRTDIIIQNDYIEAYEVILYRAGNAYLHGNDNGYGITRPRGAVGVADTSPASGATLWMIPVTPGNYQEDDVVTLFRQIDDGYSLTDTVAGNADAALGLSWSLTIPAKSLTVRSCLTLIEISAGVTPPAVDDWHFRGFCYRGESGNTQAPLGGVTLRLYVGSTNVFAAATVKRTTVSDGGGFWNFFEDQLFNYYWVEAVTPGGMSATGVSTDDGTIISTTLLRWGASPARGVHAGNKFFMV